MSSIEGNIDFFAELYKSLDNDDDEKENDLCLISNEPLTDKHVVMECGHKFNYIPLFHDLVNHKKKFNYMESANSRLNPNEIRCPYCRNRQKKLLPYYEDLNLPKEVGVNVYSTSAVNKSRHSCQYKVQNNAFNPELPEDDNNKKMVYWCCTSPVYKIYAIVSPGSKERTNFGDSNYYCQTHKSMMIKKYRAELKATQIQTQTQTEENVVLGAIDISVENNLQTGPAEPLFQTCQVILKSGPNKGNPCCNKIYLDNPDKMCRRHYMSIKLLINGL
jgi:hypothetical protein